MAEPGMGVRHTFQDAAAATGNGTAMDVSGLASVACQVTGTFVGTVTWEGTVDGSTWVAVFARSMTAGTNATTATAPVLVQIPVAGLVQLRARVSAYTSGAITVKGNGVFGAGIGTGT